MECTSCPGKVRNSFWRHLEDMLLDGRLPVVPGMEKVKEYF